MFAQVIATKVKHKNESFIYFSVSRSDSAAKFSLGLVSLRINVRRPQGRRRVSGTCEITSTVYMYILDRRNKVDVKVGGGKLHMLPFFFSLASSSSSSPKYRSDRPTDVWQCPYYVLYYIHLVHSLLRSRLSHQSLLLQYFFSVD